MGATTSASEPAHAETALRRSSSVAVVVMSVLSATYDEGTASFLAPGRHQDPGDDPTPHPAGEPCGPAAPSPRKRADRRSLSPQPAHGCRRFDPVAHSLKLLRDDGAGALVSVVYGRAAHATERALMSCDQWST